MRPKKHETTRSGDLFRARLDQIINLKHELAQLAGAIDWDWIDGEIAPLYSEKGRPGIETRFAIGLLLLKHIYGLSDEGVCAGSMIRISSTSLGHHGRISIRWNRTIPNGRFDRELAKTHQPRQQFHQRLGELPQLKETGRVHVAQHRRYHRSRVLRARS